MMQHICFGGYSTPNFDRVEMNFDRVKMDPKNV